MKICFATNYLPGYHKIWGGAEQACDKLLNLLIKNQHHVSVLTTKPIEWPKGDFDFYPVPIVQDAYVKWQAYFKVLFSFDLASYSASYKILKEIKPDILHLHNFHVLSFSLVLGAKRLGIPVVYSVYDNWCICPRRILINDRDEICKKYHGPHCIECSYCTLLEDKISMILRKKVFNFFLRKIDAFIALSKSSARILQDYGIEKEKIEVIPLPLFEEVDIQNDKIEGNTILYVGWIMPHKGFHIILEAMPEILKEIPDAKLWVIETGKSNIDVEELIRRYKLEDSVFLLGNVPHEVVEEYLNKANVVVIPEQWENVGPLFLGEAMTFAKPIVASSIGAIPEYIEDGKSGFLVEPKDSLGFAKKILWLLKNKESAIKMGREAQSRARQIFDENKILEKLLKIYGKPR